MDKNTLIKKVARFMCRHGISVGDVTNAFNQMSPQDQFDLAIEQDGKIKRVPFTEENQKLKVVGIYPFKDDDRYLELTESECRSSLNKKAKKYIPATEDFRRFSRIYDELNEAIETLHGASLRGTYRAVMCFGSVRRFYPACYVNINGGNEPTFCYNYNGKGRCLVRYYLKAEAGSTL